VYGVYPTGTILQPIRRKCRKWTTKIPFPGPLSCSSRRSSDRLGSGRLRRRWHLSKSTKYLVDLPRGKHAVSCRWVFTTKRDGHGTVYAHKARLVARGFSQKFGEDYDQTYTCMHPSSATTPFVCCWR
jgi:hypothetical protein